MRGPLMLRRPTYTRTGVGNRSPVRDEAGTYILLIAHFIWQIDNSYVKSASLVSSPEVDCEDIL